ncbi:MAG: AmmeMemoRadiSam system protein B [Candidatus Promineifilaceae bacterium]
MIATPSPHLIRPPAVAGAWYPDDPDDLACLVDRLLDAVNPVDGAPLGLIAPHAGYAYSGSVAARAFKQMAGIPYDVAVIIAADHHPPVSHPISIWARGGFATPLGVVPVDEELAQALVSASFRITFDPDAHAGEHPIEMQLPFLQRACPGCAIVPILMGQGDRHTVNALVEALLAHLGQRRAVIIASSDLSHYPAHKAAVKADRATLSALETGDAALVRQTMRQVEKAGIPHLVTAACGQGPIQVALQVTRGLGADTTTVLGYATSAQAVPDESDRVVGYGAVMMWRYIPPDLTEARQQALLAAARAAIAAHLSGKRRPAAVDDPELARRAGVFVTLWRRARHNHEEPLRGCIGHMPADRPLAVIVPQVAVSAATEDPRFPPLTLSELEQIRLEISALSPPRRVTDLSQIEIGKHGLLIRAGERQGLLLPEVPVHRGWDLDTFLANLYYKAGLPPNFPLSQAALYAFTALVFAEA